MPTDRRSFLAAAAGFAGAGLAAPAIAQTAVSAPAWTLPERFMAQRVVVRPGWIPGEVHVDPGLHYIYLIEPGDQAIRYGCAIGEEEQYVSGTFTIQRRVEWPSWTPTANMIRREPDKYAQYADGVPGGPDNPLGARALYLYEGGRDTMLRIHGTPQPWSIGRSVSSGCIRMINEHVIDLYDRVPNGTRVVLH